MNNFVEWVLTLGKQVLPLLNGTPAGAVIAIGQSIVEMAEEAKEVASESDTEKLETMLAELAPKVLAHADATAARLRG